MVLKTGLKQPTSSWMIRAVLEDALMKRKLLKIFLGDLNLRPVPLSLKSSPHCLSH
jgi:hypothetical protein